ncbi:Uncharacterized conserved protein YqgV, UPF0045/DUF77 family [Mariniphaga anaerophila]|uniref:Uncharacterized conserved protein YqgV, UPF0045/DUF77 family n=1 Tax=Mariniphaga anaerophila TaxID=1484053 RepID=A0A1M4TW25_9BACT|nr:thiamine-binding protein [Mariniphaga anaerophila]SHE48665.1 Uncharacterized conserved protein YqgV, UPF0045/DUF77 family [Mariniphaga anaerophila]
MEWKKSKINVAIQVLPEADGRVKYELVDKAIAAIKSTGFEHQVCPFETVVECTYEELSTLLEKVHEACYKAGTESMITNLKIQVNFHKNVTIDDKMEKYR